MRRAPDTAARKRPDNLRKPADFGRFRHHRSRIARASVGASQIRLALQKDNNNNLIPTNPQISRTFPFHPQRSRCIPYGTSDRPTPSRVIERGARCKLVGAFGDGGGVSVEELILFERIGGERRCFSGDIADKPIRLPAIKAAMSCRRCFARR